MSRVRDTPNPEASMSDNRLERTTELVKQVFRETWDDFYAWNDQYCRGVLESLRTKTPRDPKPLPGPLLPETDQFPARNDEDEDDDFEGIIVEDAWGNKKSYTFETVECNIDIPDWVPEYESYAPTNRSIMHGDDAELLKFMPFYDDPTFDREAYEAEFAGYEWLESNHDPDLEIIVLETAQRLVSRYQIPLHHIEETDVLPLRLFTTNHIPGVLATSKRRDFPPFPLTPGALPSSQDRRQDSPKVVMQNLAKYFCPNPNCIIGYCSVHMEEIPPLQPVSPLLSNAELVNSVDEPCSDECFLHGHDQEPPSFHWSRDDKETLEIILSSSPDTIPCDLAIICRKPCIETYWYRVRLLGSKIPEKKTSKKRSRQPSRAPSTTSEMNDEADLNALVPDADPEIIVNARTLRTRVQRPTPPVYEDNQPGYTP
ncbi:hypothetical protein AX16_002585 [Volvariella volvacea WC 439]|nr:hypothetical protein AX16_002585 [Volvariella volvacea WC 439]